MKHEADADGCDAAWPWPEFTIWDLAPYDRGLFTLSTFVEGRDMWNAWPNAVDALKRFGDVVRMLVRIREEGRRIPVRCHVKVDDLGMLDQIIPLVEAWRANGGDMTPEIRRLALSFLDAVDGGVARNRDVGTATNARGREHTGLQPACLADDGGQITQQ